MKIDTHDVIEAASTKWNFYRCFPGLVGGHCISVDPYYILHIAKKHDVDLKLINTARGINNAATGWTVRSIVKEANRRGIIPSSGSNVARVLILGATFKADCPDYRNSKPLQMSTLFQEYGYSTDLVDYHLGDVVIKDESGVAHQISKIPQGSYEIIVLAVSHEIYRKTAQAIIADFSSSSACLVVDLNDIVSKTCSDLRL